MCGDADGEAVDRLIRIIVCSGVGVMVVVMNVMMLGIDRKEMMVLNVLMRRKVLRMVITMLAMVMMIKVLMAVVVTR